jgi:hypothetical protein
MTSTEQDQIITSIAKQMSNDIDKEVLWGAYEKGGWTRVSTPHLKSRDAYVDMANWLESNCKQSYDSRGGEVIFEDAKDAFWFTLKWGCR